MAIQLNRDWWQEYKPTNLQSSLSVIDGVSKTDTADDGSIISSGISGTLFDLTLSLASGVYLWMLKEDPTSPNLLSLPPSANVGKVVLLLRVFFNFLDTLNAPDFIVVLSQQGGINPNSEYPYERGIEYRIVPNLAKINIVNNYTATSNNSQAFSLTSNTWYEIEIGLWESGTFTGRIFDINGVEIAESRVVVNDIYDIGGFSTSSGFIGFGFYISNKTNAKIALDFLRIKMN